MNNDTKRLKEELVDYDPQTGRVATPPHVVWLELSSRCNLRCVHCFTDFGIEDPRQRFMDLDILNRVGPWVSTARMVNINGVGEPLLYPEFDMVLRETAACSAAVSFNTNGLLISPRRAESLVEHGVESISVSVDGIESQMAIRGMSFETVRERLKNLQRAKEAAGSVKPHVGLCFTLFRRNVGELAEVLRILLAEVDVHAVTAQPGEILYEGMRGQNIRSDPRAPGAIREAREVARQHGVAFLVYRFEGDEDERQQTRALNQIGQTSSRFGCVDPFFQVSVAVDGGIVGCTHGLHTRLSLRDLDPEEIWNHEWYRAKRKALYAKRFADGCERCPYVNGCPDKLETSLQEGLHHSEEARFLRYGNGRQ
jgi:MoaA/NifB/PqqE/SkfB family radical SAM enzyme